MTHLQSLFGTFTALALLALPSSAGADERHHAIYGELGGSALAWSANYELRPTNHLALRAGVGAFPVFHRAAVVFPVAAYGLVGGRSHYLELGGGITLTNLDDEDARLIVPSAGYRYESEGGFLFRATFTPVVRMNDPKDVFPWVGTSFGYRF